jgi:hypothetical protein
MQNCAICLKVDEEVYRLVKCPECYRVVCENCAVRRYGRYFCSEQCARNYYFYQEEDD